jgi:hypothetical protein
MTMSYTNKFEQPSSYQPQSWPPRPHARFAHIPQGLAVLARITTWQDPAHVVAPIPVAVLEPVAAPAPVVVLAPDVAETRSPGAPFPGASIFQGAAPLGLGQSSELLTASPPETQLPVLISAEDLPATAAFFEQELEPRRETALAETIAEQVASSSEMAVEEAAETYDETLVIAGQIGQAPQYQPAIREAVQRRAKALRAHKTLATQWHLAGNATVLNRLPSLHLWAMAGCWGQLREEKLVVIDATSSGPELAQLLGWDCAAGWSDMLRSRAALSETLHHTPWPNVTLIPRGSAALEYDDELCLRQASAIGALKRDYRAVWILTAGDWDDAAQVTSQHVGERQLIVPLNCPASDWRDLNTKLVAGNVLVNGWVALNPAAATEQRRAA